VRTRSLCTRTAWNRHGWPPRRSRALVYGVSDGNRKGRPIVSVQEFTDMGFRS